MIIRKLEEDKLAFEDQFDLIAPNGKVYRHKYLDFIESNRYIKYQSYVFLNGGKLTKDQIKVVFGISQDPPYMESERDYELIDDPQYGR